jgi:hypothetical protein
MGKAKKKMRRDDVEYHSRKKSDHRSIEGNERKHRGGFAMRKRKMKKRRRRRKRRKVKKKRMTKEKKEIAPFDPFLEQLRNQ